jgi:dihydroflavonol-4-reductase
VNSQTIKRVLVTGGAGFMGSRVVRSYLDSGIKVRVVDSLQRGSLENLGVSPQALEFLRLDLCDSGQIVDAFADQDLVIHTAAMIRATTPQERLLQQRVNVEATGNIIEACRRNRVARLLHISTTAAIGISPDPGVPADESFRFNLDHVGLSYNSTKHHAEQMVIEANGPNLETVVVNPGFAFGRRAEGYQGSEVIERILRSRFVICTGGGLSIVHIDDVVEGIRRVADKGRSGQRYILSGQNLTFREIASTVCRVSGVPKQIISVPGAVRDFAGFLLNSIARARGHGPSLYLNGRYAYQFFSSEKARTEIGYEPRPFTRIVEDYLDCARQRKASPR